MPMRRPLVVGNWKLNGSLVDNERRMLATIKAVKHINQVDIGLCLPYVYLFQAQQILSNSSIMWGAQNVSQFEQGAYTSCAPSVYNWIRVIARGCSAIRKSTVCQKNFHDIDSSA